MRRTPRGGGAHGPPRFSGESPRGTLVPRSKLPHQGTAPGNAMIVKTQETQLGPQREFCHLAHSSAQTTKGTKNRQDWTITQYLTLSQTRSANSQTPTQTRKLARVVSKAAAGWRADTGPRLHALPYVRYCYVSCLVLLMREAYGANR